MGANTKIEWAHHTFNPVIGCTPVSDGCRNCYAAAHALRFADQPGSVFDGLAEMRGSGDDRRPVFTGQVRPTSPGYWDQPLRWNAQCERRNIRQRVFCASMSDVLDPAWPDRIVSQLFWTILNTPRLDWMLLTKRPQLFADRIEKALKWEREQGGMEVENMLLDWLHGSPIHNVWIGITVENQKAAMDRIPELNHIPSVVRFLSCEPLLGPIDLDPFLSGHPRNADGSLAWPELLNWVICGGESGPHARPMRAEWATSIRDQCCASGIRFFFKQWGEHNEYGKRVGKRFAGRLLDGREWNEVPA